MKIILLTIIFVFHFLVSSLSVNSEEYKMLEIQPKELVNDGYILHSITPIQDEGPRVMLYTFTKNEEKKIVSCVIELFDIAADLHTCYNITN